MNKQNSKLITSIILALTTGVVGTYLVLTNWTTVPTNKTIIENVSKVELKETSIADAVDKAYDAVVVVVAYQNKKQISSGTGFIYKQENKKSYIMTNNHVVDGADNVELIFSDNTIRQANILGKEVYSDIAVLTIDETKNIKVVAVGDSTASRLGDTVFTIGSPLGTEYIGTVTKGILSGKDRLVEVSLSGGASDWIMKVLQTDAAINPGNSGGPLLNVNGEVIGINSLKLVEDEIEGMGFAIPIEDALYYAEMLEKGDKIIRPYVGVAMYDISDTYYLMMEGIYLDASIKKGVVISEVVENSPAATAGLTKGDVIYEIEGIETATRAKFRYELYKHQPNDIVTITYYRGKEKKSTKITLTKAS